MATVTITMDIELSKSQEEQLESEGIPQKVLMQRIRELVTTRGLNVTTIKGSLSRSSTEYMRKLREWEP